MTVASKPVIRHNQASGAYQRWEPVDFGSKHAPLAEPSEKVVEEIGASDARDDSIEIAPGLSLPTADDIERIHEEAYKDGYAAGYEEGSARGRMEAAEFYQLLQGMDTSLSQLDEEVAEEIQALALEVARLVVREELAAKPEHIVNIVREALNQVPQVSATIHLHPDDMSMIKAYMADQVNGLAHRLVEDEKVARGGVLIDSAGGQIDAQISTRWRRVVESLSRSAAHFHE